MFETASHWSDQLVQRTNAVHDLVSPFFTPLTDAVY